MKIIIMCLFIGKYKVCVGSRSPSIADVGVEFKIMWIYESR